MSAFRFKEIWDNPRMEMWLDCTHVLSTFTLCRFREVRNSTFKRCHFSHCDFSNASFDGSIFNQCTYDLATTWPEGFIPQVNGLHLADGDMEGLERRLGELKTRPTKPPVHPFGVEMSNG